MLKRTDLGILHTSGTQNNHFRGRRRNCYSIAVRYVHRALVYATKARKLKKLSMANLWQTRVTAGCNEHDISYPALKESLARSDIMLNTKTLADLACWEPYSFKALTDIAHDRANRDGLDMSKDLEPPKGVYRRGMLK